MNWRIAIAAALTAIGAQSAQAQALKIGFVNTERVFREAGPAKRAQQKLEREFAARNAELAKFEKQGRDLQVDLPLPDPQKLLKNWAPGSERGMETFQNFAKAAAGTWSQSGSGTGLDKDPEPPKSKPRA